MLNGAPGFSQEVAGAAGRTQARDFPLVVPADAQPPPHPAGALQLAVSRRRAPGADREVAGAVLATDGDEHQRQRGEALDGRLEDHDLGPREGAPVLSDCHAHRPEGEEGGGHVLREPHAGADAGLQAQVVTADPAAEEVRSHRHCVVVCAGEGRGLGDRQDAPVEARPLGDQDPALEGGCGATELLGRCLDLHHERCDLSLDHLLLGLQCASRGLPFRLFRRLRDTVQQGSLVRELSLECLDALGERVVVGRTEVAGLASAVCSRWCLGQWLRRRGMVLSQDGAAGDRSYQQKEGGGRHPGQLSHGVSFPENPPGGGESEPSVVDGSYTVSCQFISYVYWRQL